MNRAHDVLWEMKSDRNVTSCVIVSCCEGAELQLHRNDQVVLRELYPDKAALYDRARQLRMELESGSRC